MSWFVRTVVVTRFQTNLRHVYPVLESGGRIAFGRRAENLRNLGVGVDVGEKLSRGGVDIKAQLVITGHVQFSCNRHAIGIWNPSFE
jgi:hypothetical protein